MAENALSYELRSDGVLYELLGGIRVRVKSNSASRVRVAMSRGNTIIPPETGDLGTGKFREKLVGLARERFGEVNGLVEDLGAIAIAFDEHRKERKEAATADDQLTNDPRLVGSSYRISGGGFVRLKNTRDGEIPQRLTNFTAHITEEVVRDDGAETQRMYRLEGQAGEKRLPAVDVPAAHFGAMNWTADAWGLTARITAGQGAKDYTREAIELLSSDAGSRHLYAHTGFRELQDGTLAYLDAAGALTSEGSAAEIEVDLEPGLDRYALPHEIPMDEDLRKAIRQSFSLVDAAPERVTAPLLGAAYLSPLSGMLTPDFALWIWGGTGSFKSTLTALSLSHFGDFNEASLPGSFESTANAQERLLFLLKDTMSVVDDWRPAVSRADASEMDRKAQRLLRSVGNRTGRGRMTSDTHLRRAYSPRGVVVATAEALPEGPAFESAAARSLSVNLTRNDVDLEKLTSSQNRKDLLRVAMAGYVRWIAGKYDELADKTESYRKKVREELRSELTGCHPRTPDAAASLIAALSVASAFAQDAGALSADEAKAFLRRVRSGVVTAARAHIEATKGGDPATRFLELLSSLFEAGRAYVKHKETGSHPPDCGSLGWEETSEVTTADLYRPRRNAEFVGWAYGKHIYLNREAAYACVSAFAARGGISFGIKQRALWDALRRSGISITDEGRADTTARIEKKTRRIVLIPKALIVGEQEK